jgi:hypothetical protein
MAQGRFFFDAGQFPSALQEFQAAAELPEGQYNPEVHTLLARCWFQMGDVGRAVEEARTARALSRDGMAADLAELHAFLTAQFGKVLVIGAGTEGSQTPFPASPILDPESKRVLEGALARLREPAGSGSTSIWLPVGSYRVGGHLVEVTAAGSARMDLRPNVGATESGIYGERGESNGRSSPAPQEKPLRRPVTPLDARRDAGRPLTLGHAFVLRLGLAAFTQQSSPSGAGRILLGWEAGARGALSGLPPGSQGSGRSSFRDRRSPSSGFGLRLAAAFTVGRAERIRAASPAPPGVGPELQLAAGPSLRAGTRLLLHPWLAWQLGYAHPVEPGLPEGYRGPLHYFVHGPDIELRATLLPGPRVASSDSRLELALRALLRESRPLLVPEGEDARPHLSVGAGFDVGLRVGD